MDVIGIVLHILIDISPGSQYLYPLVVQLTFQFNVAKELVLYLDITQCMGKRDIGLYAEYLLCSQR